MLRIISCQQTTLLLEQQADAPLPASARRSVWLHLRYCPLCHRYASQTLELAALARHAATLPENAPGLPPAARERLRQQLHEVRPDWPQ